MPVTRLREEIAGGVSIDTVIDPKFRTSMINVRFICEPKRENLAAYAILPQVLSSLNTEYPDSALMSRRLNALYGAFLGGYSRAFGGIYELSLSISYLGDRYALEGERISEEAAKLLLGCILSPVIENGGFEPTEFNTKKIDLLNQIDSEINEKVSYALNLALDIAYRGEASACRYYGTREDVEALTPQMAYEVWLEVFKTARIEISFTGEGPFDGIKPLFIEAFKRDIPEPKKLPYFAPSPCKPEPEYGEAELDVQQANLIMVFKTCGAPHTAMTVLSSLYGETPLSKLFLTVREKLSLCYFCSSAYAETKGVLYVVSGVAPENISRAKEEILKQLEEIKAGEFSDGDLRDTKLALSNIYRSVGDKVGRLDDWYHTQSLKDSSDTPDDKLKKLFDVTRGEIAEAAKRIKLDTVFVLKCKESEN